MQKMSKQRVNWVSKIILFQVLSTASLSSLNGKNSQNCVPYGKWSTGFIDFHVCRWLRCTSIVKWVIKIKFGIHNRKHSSLISWLYLFSIPINITHAQQGLAKLSKLLLCNVQVPFLGINFRKSDFSFIYGIMLWHGKVFNYGHFSFTSCLFLMHYH